MAPTGEFRVELSAAEVARYHERGYLQVERITTPEELTRFERLYDDIIARRWGEGEGRFFEDRTPDGTIQLRVEKPEEGFPEIQQTQLYKNGQRMASQVLGVPEEQLTGRGIMLLKPPAGKETSWHQDSIYVPEGQTLTVVSVWIPMEPATEENGCIQFIPGTHEEPLRPHQDGAALLSAADQARAISCPVPVGGALLIDVRGLHGAGPNRTHRPRRAFAYLFQPKPPAGEERSQ